MLGIHKIHTFFIDKLACQLSAQATITAIIFLMRRPKSNKLGGKWEFFKRYEHEGSDNF
jgi:hypothetical protein